MSRARIAEPLILAGSLTNESAGGGVSFGTSFANVPAGIINVTGMADFGLVLQTITAVVTAEAKVFLSHEQAQPANAAAMYPLSDVAGALRTFALGAVLKGYYPLGNLTAKWLLCQLRGVGGTNELRAFLKFNQRAVDGAVMPTANYPLVSIATAAPAVVDFVSPVVNVAGVGGLTIYLNNSGAADATVTFFAHYQVSEPSTASLYPVRVQAGTAYQVVVVAGEKIAVSLEQGNWSWLAIKATSAGGAGIITAHMTGLLSTT